MSTGRRLLVLLGVCGLVALPAGVLRATCAAGTCDQGRTVRARIPFCPLPDPVKTGIANGYYPGRSPDVIGVGATAVAGGARAGNPHGDPSTPWPTADRRPPALVPLAFLGTGVDPSVTLPDDLTLDRIAPTVLEVLGTSWSYPDVHAGQPIAGLADGSRPRLVLEIVWTGGGSADLRAHRGASAAWRGLTGRGAVASTEATTGSLPLDPVATLTTIGTGGPPSQHGITGGLIRDGRGGVAAPWSAGAPTSVIAAMPDDLADRDPATKIGAVLPTPAAQGIVGGTWYDAGDVADVTIERRRPERVVEAMLRDGYGADDTPDVLAVVVGGPATSFARALDTIVPLVRRAIPATTVVLAATGARSPSDAVPAPVVAAHVAASVRASGSVVEAVTAGGLFLDQEVLTADGLSSQVAVRPMLGMRASGRRVFADAFPGFAVSFARYC